MTDWDKVKQAIMNLPANYDQVVDKKMKEAPENVRIVKKVKGTYYEVSSNMLGFSVYLEVRKYNNGNDNKAHYIALNNNTSTCFIRDLIHEPLSI